MLSAEIVAFLPPSTVVGGDQTPSKALSPYLSALRCFGRHLSEARALVLWILAPSGAEVFS
jgi:hypothetical protein